MTDTEALSQQYNRRFERMQSYRDSVWKAILAVRLQAWVGYDREILDLGCGWGEFSRNVSGRRKLAMDLNPDAAHRLGDDVQFIQQDCAEAWAIPDDSLDVVFSSNFIEHLPDKQAIESMLTEARRCLRGDGRVIFLGPNVRYVPGSYWDFWDHHVAISDRSLAEVLELSGFEVVLRLPRFLPYTMSEGAQVPIALVRLYLRWPVFWRFLGKQFLLIASPR